jgi:glycosyltransferase involved in cell wall biosynthesis
VSTARGLRIAIDGRAYFQRTGIARYTRALVDSVVGASPHIEYLLLISDHHTPADVPLRSHNLVVRVSRAPWLGGESEAAILEREAREWGADLFHSIFPPLATDGVATTVTLFDLVPLTHPHLHPRAVVEAFSRHWERASSLARAFVAISEATAVEARRRLRDGVPVAVTGCGLSHPFDEAPPAPEGRHGVLFVGTNEPRKNLPVVVDAIRRLESDGVRMPFTIVGKQGWTDFNPEQATAGLSSVRCLGFVDDRTLLDEYRRAAIVVMPSTVEGFGLPVLEGMAQEALPLVSPDPALRELVEFDDLSVPVDADALAAAIERWTRDEAARRCQAAHLSASARRRTWGGVAARWVSAHEALG